MRRAPLATKQVPKAKVNARPKSMSVAIPINAKVLKAQVENQENKVLEEAAELEIVREEFENCKMKFEEQWQRRVEINNRVSALKNEFVDFVAEKSAAFDELHVESEADQAEIIENQKRLEAVRLECIMKTREATELLATLEAAKSDTKKAEIMAKKCREGLPKLESTLEAGEISKEKGRQKAWDIYCSFLKDEKEIDELRKRISRIKRTIEVCVINVRTALRWPYDNSVEPSYVGTLRREVQNLLEVQEMAKTGLLVALGMNDETVRILEDAFRETFPQSSTEKGCIDGARMLRSRYCPATENNISVHSERESDNSGAEDDVTVLGETTSMIESVSVILSGRAYSEEVEEADVALLIAPADCGELLESIGSMGRRQPLFGIDRLVGHQNCATFVILLHDPVPPHVEALFPKWRATNFGRKPRNRIE